MNSRNSNTNRKDKLHAYTLAYIDLVASNRSIGRSFSKLIKRLTIVLIVGKTRSVIVRTDT